MSRVLLLWLLPGCVLSHGVELSPATRPLPPDVSLGGAFDVQYCTHYLLGFIPMSSGVATGVGPTGALPRGQIKTGELIRAAEVDLVNISVDTRSYWWLVATSTCTRVRATRVLSSG